MVNIVSAAFAIAGLLNGGSSVTLAGVTLTGLEIPEAMPFGGQQRTIVHKLPGGTRIIDVMGGDDADIQFSGFFNGGNAASRARTLDAARLAGKQVTLSWPGFVRQVVIADFKASYERGGWWIPYSVTCTVVSAVQPPSTPSLLQSLGADVTNALGITDAINGAAATVAPVLTAAQVAVSQVQSVLPVAAALTGGSAAFLSAQSAIGSAQTIISGGLAATEGSMAGLLSAASAAGNPLGAATAAGAATALVGAVQSTQALAGLTALGAFVGRAAANLTNASA